MTVLGIDIGSRFVKIVVMKNNTIISKERMSTMSFYKDYCSHSPKLSFDVTKYLGYKPDQCVATGYGKNNTHLDSFLIINELKAHSIGALYQVKSEHFTLLDIGGQDVKVMSIKDGRVVDLALNDKCAASCGRFLENMANVLEVDLDTLGSYYENPVELNATCAIFSESELIGKISEGNSIESLCAGVNYALYQKIIPMVMAFSSPLLVLSGGVSAHEALLHYLKEDFVQVITLDQPAYTGAIGCCIHGGKNVSH